MDNVDYVKSIKGVGLKNYITFIKETFGEDGFQKVLQSLNEEQRKIITEPILVNRWYDIELIVTIQKAMVTVLSNGDESILVRASAWNAKNTLHGVYRIFLRISDPGFMIRRAQTILRNHYGQEVVVEVAETSPRNLKGIVRGFQQHQWPVEVGIMGWIQGASALTSAKNVNIRITTSLREGKGYFELAGTWDE
jgi:hypothetical protein